MIQLCTAKSKILTFILLILILTPLTSHADCDVTLQWDTSNPAPEGYQVYGREEGQDYDYDAPWWQGDSTFTQCTVDALDESKTYFFVVRAFSADEASADSNEVRYAYASDSSSLSGNDTANGAGSGSSAGCFIQSLCRFD